MGKNNKSLRIKTNVGSNGDKTDKYISVNLEQHYDTLDILSLSISTEGVYRYHVSDYGVVVGRVIANGGIGVPNAKLSLFISKESGSNSLKTMLYPYNSVYDKNDDGIRYNLLPDMKKDDCHQVVGTFPNKRMVLDDLNVLEIFNDYYKFTTRTNDAGDYMFFGIPTGSYTLHMDLDISDCGKLSQRPRDFVYKGYTIEQFENANQFKIDKELSSLSQLFTQDTTVEVKPFWGDSSESSRIGVTRQDIEISFKFEPTCVFMGSIVSDDPNEGVTVKCVPTHRMGEMERLVTGPGRIEIIRKNIDNTIEELQVKGTELIDGNGVWCFQIPMNLDYVVTDEYGNMVPTDNTSKGIPTRCEVRFRISMDETNPESVNFHRGKVLVPHNPSQESEVDYNFGSYTKDWSFKSLMWNNVYTVKSFIPRFQRSKNILTQKFTGIKKVNINGNNNPMPYNNIRVTIPFMFTLLCFLMKAILLLVGFLNKLKILLMRALGNLADLVLPYSYISNEACPDLENWYFAPNMITNPKNEINKRTCRQWENQSVCETFKEIATSVYPNGFQRENPNTMYFRLKDEYQSKTGVIAYLDGRRKETEFAVMEAISLVEKVQMITDSKTYTIIWYKEEKDGENDILREHSTTSKLVDLYSTKLEYGIKPGGDPQSIDSKNAQSKADVRINLTNNVNYLLQCVESNLAQQYEVVKFDFYNDWINGCIYLPRWARSVKYKARKKGSESIPYRIKGCLNGSSSYKKTNPSRYYVQQCSVEYNENMEISNQTPNGCANDGKLRCHKMEGKKSIQVFGGNVGLVNETKTLKGDNVYYLKPYEFQQGKNVPFFATDIVMLGTLTECNEYGLPSTFDSLVSTTYQMPPQLAATNMDDDGNAFFDLSSTAPTPNEILAWQCNSKCNEGGRMVTGRVNEKGVVKELPSYNDLVSIMAEYADSNTERKKWFRVEISETESYEGPCDNFIGTFKNFDEIKVDDSGNINGQVEDEERNLTNNDSIYYDENGKNTYKFKDKNGADNEFTVTKDTEITTYYKVEQDELKLDYEDIFPVTEMSGVDWGYHGIGFKDDDIDDLFKPGGHFLGLSCVNSETSIKSCVNLQRACEIGTTLSTRIELPYDYVTNDDSGYDKVRYLYIAPNGLISKDQIVDEGFRSAFATMNQNGLLTKVNAYGYKEYDFTYLLPDSFDGSLGSRLSGKYTDKVETGYEQYADWGEELEKRGHEIEVEDGFTIVRSSEIASNDYIDFRMGKNRKFLLSNDDGGGSMPIYRNSFYFYFGLKQGSTALDEFKKQFYAPCSKNVIVKESGSVNITPEFIGPNFDIKLQINGLNEPYTYELYRNSVDDYETYSEEESKWVKNNETLKEGEIGSDLTISNIIPGDYTLVITDSKGRNLSKTFNVGDEYFKCEYTKKVVDFIVNLKDNDINEAYKDINKFKGGYIDGDFTLLNKVFIIDNESEYRFKPVLRRKGTNEEIVRDISINNVLLWNKYYKYSEKRLYFWNSGEFELLVRAIEFDKKTQLPKHNIFQYKIDEFIVDAKKSSEYVLENNEYAVPSTYLSKLKETYGEWWKLYPFNTKSEDYSLNKEDDETLYALYKNIVAEKEGSHEIKFRDESGLEYFNTYQIETTDKFQENYVEDVQRGSSITLYHLMNDKNINRYPILITSKDSSNNFATFAISDVTINGNILIIDNPVNKSILINHLQKYTKVYENIFMFYEKVTEVGTLCKLTLYYDTINVVPLDKNKTFNGTGAIVSFDNIPVLRNIFKFHYLVLMYYGNSKSTPERSGIVGDSSCYKNNFYVENKIKHSKQIQNVELTL